jgi:predicted CXXCH cytochrome family protein
LLFFAISLALGGLVGLGRPASTAFAAHPNYQEEAYIGPDYCAQCHSQIVDAWSPTIHANAFSSPIFKRDWTAAGSDTSCLECHTTGYDPSTGKYAIEGVTCESCHGPFQPGHPAQPMSVQPDAALCATCHKTTTDEWKASIHSQVGIECQSCHNPHSQTSKAATITELCTNCHKERGESFTHSTHANAGLECSNCHMFTSPRTGNPIKGLVPTGHTFAVGSEACIGCHQDTVHTRDKIVALTGEVSELGGLDMETLQQMVQQQSEEITTLKAQGSIRLYTGLAQGAIVGLMTGGVAAWIVSRRIKVIEEDGNNDEEKNES